MLKTLKHFQADMITAAEKVTADLIWQGTVSNLRNICKGPLKLPVQSVYKNTS